MSETFPEAGGEQDRRPELTLEALSDALSGGTAAAGLMRWTRGQAAPDLVAGGDPMSSGSAYESETEY